MQASGRFIVFDGPDGAGKGTQIRRLREEIEAAGTPTVYAKDPGGTEIGERIRHLLLGFDLSRMAPRCEALLFMASRAQLVAEVVRPALAAGKAVIGDRFISATCAYQAAAGFPREDVIALGNHAVGDTWPDLTIVLDVPPEVGFERVGRAPWMLRAGRSDATGQVAMFDDAVPDAMERRPLEFHRDVRQRFRELSGLYPRPVVVIDANRPPDEVYADVRGAVHRAFP